MARLRLHEIRTGPVTVNGDDTTTFTVADASLAELTSGMADGDMGYIDVIVSITNTYDYSALTTLTVCVKYNSAGPTYDLGAVSSTVVNYGPAGSPINSITLDQSGGKLRVRALLGNGNGTPVCKCYAVFNTITP